MNFNLRKERLRQYMLTLPAKVGTVAVNFSKENFRLQGFQGAALNPWPARKGGRNTRAILVLSGALRRSIHISRATTTEVAIGTPIPYAKAHNDGFTGMVSIRAHNRTKYGRQKVGTGKFTKAGKERQRTVTTATGSIPVRAHRRNVAIKKRQFLGNSPILNSKIKDMIIQDLNTLYTT